MSASKPETLAPRSATEGGPDARGPDSGTPIQQAPAHLSELVRRHKVCWEIWPEYVVVDSHRRQAGFALELSATHEDGVKHATPGCSHCQRVYAALREIATHIVPREDRPSVYELAPYDHAIHYSPMRGSRADISLTIGIFHRKNLDDPVGQCQERCLTEMKQRLLALGAQEGRWSPYRRES